MTKIPPDDFSEGLYKLRIRESEKLKTVLELYNLEIHQKKLECDYDRLAVPRAEQFGDLITSDHKVLSDNCESRNNHRYAVVVQDLATQWIQAYPCKNKTSQETQRSSQKFLEPERKPKVIYTDNYLEFGKACEDLSWNHCTWPEGWGPQGRRATGGGGTREGPEPAGCANTFSNGGGTRRGGKDELTSCRGTV